ncbi:MAG: hypothetical protein KBF92_09155 [Bacteroidia bacterium]|nr:hypothetical protein [Bacteroidia bacterium]
MKEFMIIVGLPDIFSPRFISLIPEHRSVVNEMMNEGVILSYALAEDRSNLWIVMSAKNKSEVLKNIARFPLVRYMKPQIKELMFQQSATFILPEPSLN